MVASLKTEYIVQSTNPHCLASVIIDYYLRVGVPVIVWVEKAEIPTTASTLTFHLIKDKWSNEPNRVKQV